MLPAEAAPTGTRPKQPPAPPARHVAPGRLPYPGERCGQRRTALLPSPDRRGYTALGAAVKRDHGAGRRPHGVVARHGRQRGPPLAVDSAKVRHGREPSRRGPPQRTTIYRNTGSDARALERPQSATPTTRTPPCLSQAIPSVRRRLPTPCFVGPSPSRALPYAAVGLRRARRRLRNRKPRNPSVRPVWRPDPVRRAA